MKQYQDLDTRLKGISQDVVDAYRAIYKDKLVYVILYGSYSRGDFTNESDIDYVGIVDADKNQINMRLDSLWDLTSEIDLNRDAVISAMATSYDVYDKADSLYIQNVRKDGLKVYDREKALASQPNKETVAAMLEAEKIAKDSSVKGYTDIDELFVELKS